MSRTLALMIRCSSLASVLIRSPHRPAALRWKVSKVLLIMQVSPLACGTPSDITVAGIRSGNIYRVEK